MGAERGTEWDPFTPLSLTLILLSRMFRQMSEKWLKGNNLLPCYLSWHWVPEVTSCRCRQVLAHSWVWAIEGLAHKKKTFVICSGIWKRWQIKTGLFSQHTLRNWTCRIVGCLIKPPNGNLLFLNNTLHFTVTLLKNSLLPDVSSARTAGKRVRWMEWVNWLYCRITWFISHSINRVFCKTASRSLEVWTPKPLCSPLFRVSGCLSVLEMAKSKAVSNDMLSEEPQAQID